MKLRFIKYPALITVLLLSMSGCITNDDYNTPKNLVDCAGDTIAANLSVRDFAATASGQPMIFTSDSIIEAYVTSSDERGNFFKTISLQTIGTYQQDPIGFSVAIDNPGLFTQGFVPGKKVYIKLKDLYYGYADGSIKIGNIFQSTPSSAPQIGRLSRFDVENRIVASCTTIDENALVRRLSIGQALNNNNLNTLIELKNVQFAEEFLEGTYFDENDDANTAGGATNRILTDLAGGRIIFRTSSFANFSGNKIPEGNGTVRGVLTKFGQDFQFVARTEADINLTGERFDANPPIVGDAIQFGLYNETFNSYAVNNRMFPNAINDPAIGSKVWEVKSFGNDKYIQMSSFANSSGIREVNRTLFIIPIDMTLAQTLSFQTKAGFDDGAVLKVYYSTNYTVGGNISDAELIDITSNFAIQEGPANGYSATFTDSGVWNIPTEITGNGFFIFEYKGDGNNDPTTTMQLNNIIVN